MKFNNIINKIQMKLNELEKKIYFSTKNKSNGIINF